MLVVICMLLWVRLRLILRLWLLDVLTMKLSRNGVMVLLCMFVVVVVVKVVVSM